MQSFNGYVDIHFWCFFDLCLNICNV